MWSIPWGHKLMASSLCGSLCTHGLQQHCIHRPAINVHCCCDWTITIIHLQHMCICQACCCAC